MAMTMLEATDLAFEISANHPTMRVYAIGLFAAFEGMPPEDLPWKVGIVVEGHAKPRIIETRDDLLQYLPKPKPVMVTAAREYQETLF